MTPKQLAIRWFQELWNEKNSAVISELMHPEARACTEGGSLLGPDAFKEQVFATLSQAFPDVRLEIEQAIEEGEHVVIRWRAIATHTGPLMGLAASQRKISFCGMTWLTFRDGKITEGWDRWNSGGLFALLSQGAESPTAKMV